MSVQRSNLNIGSGFEWRLVNAVKESQSPFNNAGTATGYLQTDPMTGYPTELTNGVSFTLYIRPDATPTSTPCIVKWRGLGAYLHTSFGTPTGLARTRNGITWNTASSGVQATNGRMTFTVTTSNGNPAGSFTSAATLKGDGRIGASNRLTDVIICRADEEDYIDDQMFAGVPDWRIFRPSYINLLQSYQPRCLRFMDDQMTNTSIRSRWEDQPSLSAMSLSIRPYVNIVSSSSVLGLITRTGTDVYVCDAYTGMPGTYTHGEIVQGHVIVSNTTTTPTLNVGGRGAKPILNGTNPLPINPVVAGNAQTSLLAGVQPAGNGSYTFVYDQYFTAGSGVAGNGAWIYTPNGAVLGRTIESMVALCNASGIPGWFCIPAYATDNYVTQLANYLLANYTPSEVNIEYANEIWNTALGFSMSLRVNIWGVSTFTSPAIGLGSNAPMHTWYGLRFRQISQIMRPILGTRLKMILAMQGSDGDLLVNLTGIDQAFRLQNTNYATTSGTNAAYQFADYHSYGWYHRPVTVVGDTGDAGWSSVTQAATLKSYVDIWTANNSDTTGFVWMRDQWLVDTAITSRLVVGGRVDLFNAQATSFGNVQTAVYEMNHQIDAPSTGFTGGASLIVQAPSAMNMTCSNVNAFSALGFSGTVVLTKTGSAVSNKLNAPITSTTTLSGAVGTNSIQTNFVAGDTITINAVVITFVASGATGNQLNVTDTIGTMLAKFDSITAAGTGSSVAVNSQVWQDSTYGGQGGKINKFLLAFLASSYYQTVTSSMLSQFYAYSRSLSGSLYGIALAQPWLSFAKLQPFTGTLVSGDVTQQPYGNWNAHVAWNNKTTRTFTVKH